MALDIKNSMLKGPGIKFKRAAHEGKTIEEVTALVIFSTGGNTLDGAVNWFAMPGSGFAPHLVIGLEGEIVQMLPFNESARFGGTDTEIGIAVVNPGRLRKTDAGEWITQIGDVIFCADGKIVSNHDSAWVPYNAAQIQTLLRLAALFRTHKPEIAVKQPGNFSTLSGSMGYLSPGLSVGDIQLLNGFDPNGPEKKAQGLDLSVYSVNQTGYN